MNKRTYRIIGATLAIPGVPGTWHAGQEVDVDTDTNTVLNVRLLPTTPEDADTEATSSIIVTGVVDGIAGISEVIAIPKTGTVYSSNVYSAIGVPEEIEDAPIPQEQEGA